MNSLTKEPQYQFLLKRKPQAFGLMSSQVWMDDPRRLVFLLARYKFVSKMLFGKKNVLEIGCADAFGSRIVRQEVPNLTAIDFDPIFIRDAKKNKSKKWPIKLMVHNILKGPVLGKTKFDACYCCDVIEHISQDNEDMFMSNLCSSLDESGVAIIGSPSIESQAYASPPSKEGHINCKSGSGLRELMKRHFSNVFLFSMNDEVIHTGFSPMAHYLFAIGCQKYSSKS
jgi:2-polyprenyl-3-methyl-5-hydroxy-6-metoxy-1,4-benzoquinol methylase